MDWAQSGRRDSYRFCAVDPFTLMESGEITCIPSECSVTFGYYTDNKIQASISMPASEFDGMGGKLVRVSHTVELPDGTAETETLGTFFVDTAEKETDGAVAKRRCNCYSTMWRLSKSLLRGDFVYRVGDNRYANLKRLMEYAGCTVVAADGIDTTLVHTADGAFPMLSERLDCANEYAGWSNWQITVDDYGRQVVGPYVLPANRAPRFDFENGRNCVYLPSVRETFTGELYNEVVAKWSREKDPGDGYGTHGTAYAELPASNPYAFANCGARMPGKVELREPVAQIDLQAIADDYLAQHDAAIRYIEIEHVGIPHLRAGDTVFYTNTDTGDENLLCEITQMQISSLGPLCLTKTKLKAVGA